MSKVTPRTPLGPLLQQFFVERLMQQLQASPRTVSSYRDTFRLLLDFAHRRLHRKPVNMTVEDLNATLVLSFLEHLEKGRRNLVRSRNARFAAIRSFLQYASQREPTTLAVCGPVLSIPMKRFERPILDFLPREPIEAIIAAPDTATWAGRRDRVMLATLYNTGARASELLTAQQEDLILDGHPALRLHGKGRKDRSVPLWNNTATLLRSWLRELPPAAHSPLFPNSAGTRLSRTMLRERLNLAVKTAAQQYPDLKNRRVTPHGFRHSIAMHLLQSGVDITVIALWLGHESPSTTHMYIQADLQMKERALKNLKAPKNALARYRPPDRVLDFLQHL